MKSKLPIGIVIAVLITAIICLSNLLKKERIESKRQSGNVEALFSELKTYKVRDSLNVAESKQLRLTIEELKEYREADAKLIKELKLKPSQVEYITHTKVVTKDSIVFVLKDSCFNYADRWAEFNGCIRSDTVDFNYQTSDSLSTVVNREYKHHFLWFRWGTKGYRMKIVNHNPRSRITYNEFIKIEK
jgi:hypothetical protein|nr:MAG TPA: hypothetical protein [Bacteriophage sp.]